MLIMDNPMENFIERISRYENLSQKEIEYICNEAADIFIFEPNVPRVESPVIIVGDIHGQFSDLLNIIHIGGTPGSISYIFLGDYVDRGDCSLECILLLLIYKIMFPKNIFLLRGNHEQKIINKVYGFYDKCQLKYGNSAVYNLINCIFSSFNIAAIVDNKYFCVHGGISPRISVNKLDRIDRFERITEDNVVNDLMWSDPYYKQGATFNPRGCGYLFGEDILKQFLMYNNLEMLIRSHQLAIEGYKWDFGGLCLTVWSAPDYMGKCLNPGSILLIEKDQPISRTSLKLFKKTKKGAALGKNVEVIVNESK